MKLLVMFLVTVCCCSLADTLANRPDRTLETRKLIEVFRQLTDVKEILQHNEQMLNTPPQNIEECCCLSALKCFRANFQVHFNVSERRQWRLYKSLTHPLTERGLDFCRSANTPSACGTCDSHPKANAEEFFSRLESLIQRAINRLNMD